MHYLFCVHGHLDPQWSDWLGGLTIVHDPDGTSQLRGPVPDQAALYGLITRIRDLGLELISIKPVAPTTGATSAPDQ
ncbi:MAG: hypothetical protein HGA45_37800 [Chloroflexales bacterium]|nr:hypothetical protein [Chloroflexales bacterium]